MFSGGEEGLYTDAEISLHTLLVKYYNDLLGRQCSERDRDEVTYVSVGNVTTMKSLELFSRNLSLENWHTLCQGVYKKGPQQRSM